MIFLKIIELNVSFLLLNVLVTGIKVGQCQRIAEKLRKDLFSNYDPMSRPVENSSSVTNVCVGLYILQVVDLSEKSQVIEANIQLLYIWDDDFLKWNSSNYGNIEQLYIKSSEIWTPDIVIMDSTEGKQIMASKSEKYMLIVSKTGKIKWHYQTLSKSLCQIDPFGFPFDEQVCSIKIRSWSRDKSMLNLRKRNLKVKVKENIKTEWFIVDSAVHDASYFIKEHDRQLEFTVLDFQLRLRRVTTYYFVKIIFPFTIISCMTLFTFMLAPDSGEKLTLDVTVLLSLVFYLQVMSEYIPKGYSRMPLLTLFALGNFILVLVSCVITVVILRLYYNLPSYRSVKRNQVPYYLRFFIFRLMAPACWYKTHFRRKDEVYESVECYERFKLNVKPEKKKPKYNKSALILKLNSYFDETVQNTRQDKGTSEEYEMYGRRILMHMKTLNRTLLLNKRQLDFESERDKVLMRDESMRLEDDNGLDEYDETVRSIFEFAKTMYIEEWKQVALVLDRFGVYFGFVLKERSIDKYRRHQKGPDLEQKLKIKSLPELYEN